MSWARLSACMLIFHKGHTDTIQVYSVTVMTHVKALQPGHSSQGTSEPITPELLFFDFFFLNILFKFFFFGYIFLLFKKLYKKGDISREIFLVLPICHENEQIMRFFFFIMMSDTCRYIIKPLLHCIWNQIQYSAITG